MTSVWLEVALNGPWSRARQPGIPLLADEISSKHSLVPKRADRSFIFTPMIRSPGFYRVSH